MVSPHPGQGNPGQFTQDEGEVSARPAVALNERILAAAADLVPQAGRGVVVAVLDHLLRERLVTGRQSGVVAASLRQERLKHVELDHARLVLRLVPAQAPGLAGADVVDGGQDGARPGREIRRRRRPERILP